MKKVMGLPPKLYVLLVVCTLGGSVVGIDTALVSGAQLFFITRFNLDTSLQGLTIAATLLGALVGAVLSTILNKYVGRKGAMFFGGIDAIAAGLIEGFSNIWGILLLGRLILGICFGIMTSTIPMYLAECAPTDIRGVFTSVYQLAYAFGYFIGLIVDVIFVHVEHGWRFMLASVIVPAALVTLGLFFAAESPRWLLAKGRENAAWNSLTQLRSSEQVAVQDFDAMRQFLEKERETMKIQPGFFRTFYEKPSARRPIMLGIALQIAQQFCGVNAVMFYFDYVLQLAGMTASRSIDVSVALGFATVLFTFPTFWLIDRVGRRFLLLSTMPFLSIMLWICGFSFFGGTHIREALNISGTLLFRFFYGPGLGPVPWVIVAEIYPWYIRSQCLTMNSFVSYMLNFVVSFSWPTMLRSMHAQGAFSFFAGFTLLSTLFIYLFVPETKGVEMEAIQQLFQYPLYTIAKKNLSETKAHLSKWPIFRRCFVSPEEKETREQVDDNPVRTCENEQETIKTSFEASSSKA
ncbi:MFS transporter, SP family, sugar:H+ symporter [Galdieria sulphuraria]|uniref:MFS transporter, SP family, sugar:H+ symporter n=1 Tax=Galdieria sulphuraria TaxID=130081 RepID=M2X468_GALSU|nr:MFS transporter, SP family, sugar:H+ symporter [Galdieria sulphuraria]EME31225.1 MFS transporter, SP family, sugar:H+ symporter [Galdieria sulphuraria]|eukprot:XP_005707745.1 MFS transporter, SP family, sugar:H+ symporter [Galdieria sulphuraria]